MNTLKIDFDNCYGIKRLSHEFSFAIKHTHLIYAPNGMMKTSFARTLKGLSGQEKKRANDRLHPERVSKDEVFADGNPLQPTQIFVADPEDQSYDSSASFTNFLVNNALKTQYEAIYADLNEYINRIMAPLSTVSQSTDCRDELLRTFLLPNGSDNIFGVLERLAVDVQNQAYTNYGFRYNYVFDKGEKVKKFVEKNYSELQQYISQYNALIATSQVFRSVGGHTFGTHQANELQKYVDGGDFFEVDHKITLHDGTIVTSSEQLMEIFDHEKDAILNNADLKKTFDKITKAVDTNQEVRTFKQIITSTPAIILELADYEEFRKKTWKGYLCDASVRQHLIDYYNHYQQQKPLLNNIIQQAKSELPLWHEIIDLYNDRFHVPFKVEIVNHEDIILKKEAAKLKFIYSDDQNQDIPKEKNEIIGILSKGEKRAFYILQLLFDIESRKRSADDNLIVFDDIADSFDYQNKYAIIEYLNDLNCQAGNMYMVVLTHNFDFYRSLALRLGLTSTSWMCVKKADNTLTLHKGEYQRDLFKHLLSKPNDDKVFISLIPFVRNLVEYTDGDTCADYLKLTSCLHLKADTMIIKDDDVIDIIKSFNRGRAYGRQKSNTGIYQFIIATADAIAAEAAPDEIKIENKIVLSIACRLKAEVYLKQQLLAARLSEQDLTTTSNQTAFWTSKFKTHCANDPHKSVIERVNMMTPEFIHINSFMYEPLIDLSVHHLIKLYRDCSAL